MYITAVKSGNVGTGDLAFVSHGYCNWKDATGTKGACNAHQNNNIHKEKVFETIFFEVRYFRTYSSCLNKGLLWRGDNDEAATATKTLWY